MPIFVDLTLSLLAVSEKFISFLLIDIHLIINISIIDRMFNSVDLPEPLEPMME